MNEKRRKAGLERKVAPRNIKECLLKTRYEANALPNFKMEVANTHQYNIVKSDRSLRGAILTR